ncbi:MAG: bis(5'-nucleosyl)-tetraphosphatase (symmetrical) YqeK [Oscillospiraceae bacterium]|nr:bis(5'-nucleosyl)-tetraphosphatase (symmetrical) YqeK [Oscillospiraceae bacterium]MCL2279387.1 bis(5'-nucleosyl)-tetraphosphatase (symmetrical) YqeK [Oscillospiraceae bacterium]
MRIGIFGGSFNPPHNGHVQAANVAISSNKLDLLIVVPTGTPPHKKLPENSPSPEMRLEMTKNAFSELKNTIISDAEILSTEPCYTIDTVNSIKSEYPGSEMFLLLGDDMHDSLLSHKWKDSKKLLRLVTPILLPRHVIDISSTELREMLPNREGTSYISDDNYSYIIKHRLYNAKPDWDWLRGRAHEMLDPGRIPHVDACEIEAMRLAERWNVSFEDAREAAILHDITKKLDFNENLCIITGHGEKIYELKKGEEKLLHSITGSLLAKSMFGMSDAVTNAIRWHTTGKSRMSMLEKIIYLADYTESTRNFPEVEELRKKAYSNIDDAMKMGLEMTVSDLLSRGISPSAVTYDALNDLPD